MAIIPQVIGTAMQAKSGECAADVMTAKGTVVGERSESAQQSAFLGSVGRLVQWGSSYLPYGIEDSTASRVSGFFHGAVMAVKSGLSFDKRKGFFQNLRAITGAAAGTALAVTSAVYPKVNHIVQYANGFLLFTTQGVLRMTEGEYKRGGAMFLAGVGFGVGALCEYYDVGKEMPQTSTPKPPTSTEEEEDRRPVFGPHTYYQSNLYTNQTQRVQLNPFFG